MGQKSSATADPRWTLLTCILASSLSFVDASVTNVALPAIRSSFAADPQEVQWVVNAYLLPLSALLLLGGALGDQFGRRRLLVLGTSLFGCSSLCCACAPSLQILLLGRMFRALELLFFSPTAWRCSMPLILVSSRGRAVEIWAAAGAAAAAIAPLIGGWLIGTAGWSAIFYINLPLAAGAIGLALRFVHEGKTQSVQTDFLGAFLATAALGALTYGLTLWSSHRRMEPAALIGVGSQMTEISAFVLVEYRRKENAMVPIPLLSNRCFGGLNLLTFLLYGAFGAAMLLIPYVLITSGSYSPFQAGLALLPLPVLMTSASPMVGSLAVASDHDSH